MTKSKNKILFYIGICGLSLGLMVYIIARPLGSTYLHNYLKYIISFFAFMPDIFGCLGQWAADFLHVFSFSLISISLFSRSKNSRLFYCVFWMSANIAFEIGQAHGMRIAGYIPSWFCKIPVLENTKTFFVNGRFDIIDIAAFILGAITAFLVSELVLSEKKVFEPIKTEVRRYA